MSTMGIELKEQAGQSIVAKEQSMVAKQQSLGKMDAGAKRGMRITFQDLSVIVDDRGKRGAKRHILAKVSGFFLPGRMAVMMGPSGSGKTTLLDVLSGRKNEGKLEGSILFEGHKPSLAFLRRFTGYVEQFDTLIGNLTVFEMMMYTAELKRPLEEPTETKITVVNELIDMLGLEICKNLVIGNRLIKGISGGQSKRVNIGIALVTQPHTLFLDEPTTGLDSYTSNEVMTIVRQFASTGVTVLCTLHSPTSYTFSLFDDLMLLVNGRTVYFGKNDSSVMAMLNVVAKIEPSTHGDDGAKNEAEEMVEIITRADRDGLGAALAEGWEASTHITAVMARLDEICKQKTELSQEMLDDLHVKKGTSTPSWWFVVKYWQYRASRDFRSGLWLAPRIADKVLLVLIVGTLYWRKMNRYEDDNVINMSAVLFLWVMGTVFASFAYIPALVLERPLYVRERADGLYRPIAYLVAKLTQEIAISAVNTQIFALVVWFMCDLQGNWGIFMIVYFMGLIIGVSLGYLASAACPTMDAANAALPVYAVPLIFFMGFLIRFDSMPRWWYWYSYLNHLRWGWTALMVNHFENNDIPYIDGKTVLEYYGMQYASAGVNVAYMVPFFFFWNLLTWLVLAFKKLDNR